MPLLSVPQFDADTGLCHIPMYPTSARNELLWLCARAPGASAAMPKASSKGPAPAVESGEEHKPRRRKAQAGDGGWFDCHGKLLCGYAALFPGERKKAHICSLNFAPKVSYFAYNTSRKSKFCAAGPGGLNFTPTSRTQVSTERYHSNFARKTSKIRIPGQILQIQISQQNLFFFHHFLFLLALLISADLRPS